MSVWAQSEKELLLSDRTNHGRVSLSQWLLLSAPQKKYNKLKKINKYREINTDLKHEKKVHRGNMLLLPEMTPLVRPGMPCIRVMLLLTKYSSQVALSSGPSQNSLHTLVVTVWLSTISVFRHLSKFWFCRVRFPNMQTLDAQRRSLNRKTF